MSSKKKTPVVTSQPQKKGRAFWGPSFWTSIHSVAAVYRPEKAEAFKRFIYALPNLLPCVECGEHLKQNLEKLPPENYLRNNHDLFFWTYVLHDTVNQQHNHLKPREPPKYSPPFEDCKAYYFRGLSEDCSVCEKY